MSYSIEHCGVVIIAAGASKRLGKPKQLLEFEGLTLLNRIVREVKIAGNFPITLVLGYYAEKIEQELATKDIDIVMNPNWEEGMASSIKVGLAHLVNQYPNTDGAMILVCDQPFITANHIKSLMQLQLETKKSIASCYYAQVLGTPALFHHSIFNDLMALEGDIGAKNIINRNEANVAKLYFDKGLIDIDSLEDYKLLLEGEK